MYGGAGGGHASAKKPHVKAIRGRRDPQQEVAYGLMSVNLSQQCTPGSRYYSHTSSVHPGGHVSHAPTTTDRHAIFEFLIIRCAESSDLGPKSDGLGHRILKSNFVPSDFYTIGLRKKSVFFSSDRKMRI